VNNIHPTALVSGKAQLGAGNEIGAFVVIEDDVVMGDNNSCRRRDNCFVLLYNQINIFIKILRMLNSSTPESIIFF
jgi:acyl-[acyl carrier protein]--UDP-N-acetylglucosamine O-acyltransferase